MRFVFCAGLARSAGTMQYQLVKALVEHKDVGHGAGFYYSHIHYDPHQITVLKTEQPQSWMLDEADVGLSAIVSIYRDPRDVAVSLYHFLHARHDYAPDMYDDWTQDTILDVWLPRRMHWYQVWETQPHLQFAYESYYPSRWHEMLYEIGDYLSLPVTRETAKHLAQDFSLAKNTRRQRRVGEWIADKGSMLTRFHISPADGTPGTWKNVLTFAQRDLIETTYYDWMVTHGYL